MHPIIHGSVSPPRMINQSKLMPSISRTDHVLGFTTDDKLPIVIHASKTAGFLIAVNSNEHKQGTLAELMKGKINSRYRSP